MGLVEGILTNSGEKAEHPRRGNTSSRFDTSSAVQFRSSSLHAPDIVYTIYLPEC